MLMQYLTNNMSFRTNSQRSDYTGYKIKNPLLYHHEISLADSLSMLLIKYQRENTCIASFPEELG